MNIWHFVPFCCLHYYLKSYIVLIAIVISKVMSMITFVTINNNDYSWLSPLKTVIYNCILLYLRWFRV